MRRCEMNDKEPSTYDRFQTRYEESRVPWDDPSPPPELVALAAALAPGRALDLGCGYGRAAIHLAGRGWWVDAVDFIPQAIAIARQRAASAGVGDLVHFHVASADDLAFLQPPYDLAVDVGCMHSFTEEMLVAYRAELVRLLRPGGLYVVFAHLRDEDAGEADGPRGIPEATLTQLLAAHFSLARVVYGTTQVEDKPPWNSGWFWFCRR